MKSPLFYVCMGLISSVFHDVGYLSSLKILLTSDCNAFKKPLSSRHILRISFFIMSTPDALELLNFSLQAKISLQMDNLIIASLFQNLSYQFYFDFLYY